MRSPALGSMWYQNPRASYRLLAEVETLRAFGVELDLFLHEFVHLFQADVYELETALGGELFHLRVVVERGPQVRQPLLCLRWRRLRHADSTVGAVDPIDTELAKRRRVRQQRVAVFHRYGW